ncbi:MAG TPA: VOC family protein [Nitrososphaerales archaeon]|nr:VOC family protein [Nitrososphaerales archaeon]
MWISYFGIRVTDLNKSRDFYTKVFDLVEIAQGGDEVQKYVLFKDRMSGQRIELNWYGKESEFCTPYVPGEGLDHIGVRVKSLEGTLKRLAELGIYPATKELGALDEKGSPSDKDVWALSSGHNIAYIKDPDGNFIELYDHPEEPWGQIPVGY